MTQGDPQEKPRQAHQLDGAFPCNSTETETNENRQSGPGGTRSGSGSAAAAGTHKTHPKNSENEQNNKKENPEMTPKEALAEVSGQIRRWQDQVDDAQRILARPYSLANADDLNSIDEKIADIPLPARIAGCIMGLDMDDLAAYMTRIIDSPTECTDPSWFQITITPPPAGRITPEEITS